MQSATFIPPIKSSAKAWNELMELDDLLDRISYYRRTWRAADTRKAETITSPVEEHGSVAEMLGNTRGNFSTAEKLELVA